MKKELILMVGPIGSGKTTYSNKLTKHIRISQDEMGKNKYFKEFLAWVESGFPRLVIDRMNFNKEQRKRFITPARELGYEIHIIEFITPRDECFNRVMTRTNHPTVEANNPELANKILDFYYKNYETPSIEEYDSYTVLGGEK